MRASSDRRLTPWAADALALLTAGVYGYSAWTKWAYPDAFRRALSGYGVGGAAAGWAARLVPAAEFALAVALLLFLIWQAWAWLEAGLWLATAGFLGFTALMSWALAHGLGQGGCGCFASAEPLGPWDIVRDIAFAAAAAAGALLSRAARRAGAAG
ncbi:MAG: hypothetical protein IMW98_09265 [Firmicutes bacterium]|nr:hypothetical protein [Bacillota bacterium]